MRCAKPAGGYAPTFLLVDFVDEGHPLQAAMVLNGLMDLHEAVKLDHDIKDYMHSTGCKGLGCTIV